jgi:ribosomal-protein-alanine N-acetyltransferase
VDITSRVRFSFLEAAQGVMKFAKEVVGLKRIVAIVDPANAGSVRVLEKLGMKFEKLLKLSENDIDLKLFSVSL